MLISHFSNTNVELRANFIIDIRVSTNPIRETLLL